MALKKSLEGNVQEEAQHSVVNGRSGDRLLDRTLYLRF